MPPATWRVPAGEGASRLRGCGAEPVEEQGEEAFRVDDLRHAAVRSPDRAPSLTALAHRDPRRLPLRQARVDGKTDRQRVVQVHVTPETERLLRERLNAGGERAGPAGQRGVELVPVVVVWRVASSGTRSTSRPASRTSRRASGST